MAGVTTGIIGAGLAGAQIVSGLKSRKEAKSDMNSYERADLENAFENIQISTLGSDLAREELQRGTATVVDALQQGGSRMVTAGLPSVQSSLIKGANEERLALDKQVQDRDRLIAGDNVNIRNIRENRDAQNLAAISSQYNAANQDIWSGALGLASSAMSIGRSIEDNNSLSVNQPQQVTSNTLSTTQPQVSLNGYAYNGMFGNPNSMFDPNFGSIGNEFITRDIWGTNNK